MTINHDLPQGEVKTLPDYSHLSHGQRIILLAHYLEHVTIHQVPYHWCIGTNIPEELLDQLQSEVLKDFLGTWNEKNQAIDQASTNNPEGDYSSQLILSAETSNSYQLKILTYNGSFAEEDEEEIFFTTCLPETKLAFLAILAAMPVYNNTMSYAWH